MRQFYLLVSRRINHSMLGRHLFIVILLLCPLIAWADEWKDVTTNVIYEFNPDGTTAQVRAGRNNAGSPNTKGDIAILAKITVEGKEYDVTSIGESAFIDCSNLTSVIIPSSVTWIGERAFYNCQGLKSVTIPMGVRGIGLYTFAECKWLKSLILPNSLTYIGDNAFQNCSSLTSITLSENLASIGDNVFQDCRSLASITIPSSVTSIGKSAFSGCRSLKAVHIMDLSAWCNIFFVSNPLSYAHHLFLNDTEITDLVIPEGVTSIGAAFQGCIGLTSVTIPNSVMSIGISAFQSCAGLTSVTIPNNVTTIGESAFEGCSGLTSVTIGNSVMSIGRSAFSGCSGLTSLAIPGSVTSIGAYAFYGCSLSSVQINDLESWCSIDFSCTYDAYSSYVTVTSDYSSNPLSFAHHPFMDGKEVTELIIPYNVTHISDGAFVGCNNMKTILLHENVTHIGDKAFAGCTQVTDYYSKAALPPTCIVITGDYEEECPEIADPELSKRVVADIWRRKNYYNSPDSIGYWMWRYGFDPQMITLHVPAASIDSYKAAEPWSRCKKIVALEDVEVDGINYRLSYSDKTAKVIQREDTYSGNVMIPTSIEVDGVTYTVNGIDDYAFQRCEGLTSIVIPESVVSIGGAAFELCTGLSDIVIPRNVTTISGWAFASCSGLKTIRIPNSVATIRSSAFRRCTALTDVFVEATNVPTTVNDAFDLVDLSAVCLHVPASAYTEYKAVEPWSNFGSIVPNTEKCAAPSIVYKEGMLTFQCATKNAECVTTITDSDIRTHYGNQIPLSVTYLLTVYAKAEGYENSDIVTATLCWIDAVPDVGGSEDISVDISDVKANPVLIQNQGSVISIDGAEPGMPICIYDTEGRIVGSSTVADSTTYVDTHLTRGKIAIVRMGNRSIKVLLR